MDKSFYCDGVTRRKVKDGYYTSGGKTITATLGARSSSAGGEYIFMALKAPPYNMNGRYADIMATECSKHGMKPVCARSDRGDTQCQYDPAALYVPRVFPLCALMPRVQGSSGAVATLQFVWRGHAKTRHHSGRAVA